MAPKVQVHRLYSKADIRALITAAMKAQFSRGDEQYDHDEALERMQMLADLCVDMASALKGCLADMDKHPITPLPLSCSLIRPL